MQGLRLKYVEFLENHRPRSRSPKKKPSTASGQSQTIHRTLDYTHSQCKLEGCSAAIVVEVGFINSVCSTIFCFRTPVSLSVSTNSHMPVNFFATYFLTIGPFLKME
jgi:hypothetical protein